MLQGDFSYFSSAFLALSSCAFMFAGRGSGSGTGAGADATLPDATVTTVALPSASTVFVDTAPRSGSEPDAARGADMTGPPLLSQDGCPGQDGCPRSRRLGAESNSNL